jgi:hypothetical protein
MSTLRELTNAELDFVSGGAMKIDRPTPQKPMEPLGGNPIIIILEDILRLVEGGQTKAPAPAQKFC